MPASVYACLRKGFISAVDIGFLLPKTMVRRSCPGDSNWARRVDRLNSVSLISTNLRSSRYTFAYPSPSHIEATLNGEIEDAVETPHKGAGILKRHALHEKCLVKKEPSCVLSDGIIGAHQQLLHNFVIGINLERGLWRRDFLLAHSAQHLLHLQRRLLII